jgi:hypothetical protein
MRVDRLRPGEPASPARAGQGTGRFASLLGSPAGAETAGGVLPSAPVGMPMTYDAASDAVSADKEARRHGRALLRALGAIQLALLGSGQADEGGEAHAQLARLAATAPQADDPVLRLILREIGVRAAVELARIDA